MHCPFRFSFNLVVATAASLLPCCEKEVKLSEILTDKNRLGRQIMFSGLMFSSRTFSLLLKLQFGCSNQKFEIESPLCHELDGRSGVEQEHELPHFISNAIIVAEIRK
jgi:hypothetical protein